MPLSLPLLFSYGGIGYLVGRTIELSIATGYVLMAVAL
jgi:hypothetical protein